MDPKVERLLSRAVSLAAKFEKRGDTNHIDEAIALDRQALELRPPSQHERHASLTSLAGHLTNRYKHLGTMEDLEEAILLGREAVILCLKLEKLGLSMTLENLGCSLFYRYKQLGEIRDLNEAIALGRDALAHRPPKHPDRSISLTNLTARLSLRYKQLRAIEDLSEAIFFGEAALALRPPGHPSRPRSLGNLALCLSDRYRQLGNIEDLNDAIVLGRDALVLRPLGHPRQATSLIGLAASLSERYKQRGIMEDLTEAITLCRDALELCPPGHPSHSKSLSNLAVNLSTRYDRIGILGDLNEAIGLSRGALALCPPGHPYRSTPLENLAGYLRTRFMRSNLLDDNVELFNLYTKLADVSQIVSSADLSATRAWTRVAEEFQHSTTLLAYRTSLRLLIHHLAILPSLPQHLTVIKSFTSSLAVDAFSACLRNDKPTEAVELLEQGRGIFWSQLVRLRSPLDDLIAYGPAGEELAREFTQLILDIRIALDSPEANQHDRLCDLNIKLEKVVTKIRELPPFARFLLPLLFSDLREAACKGPVIIVNASKHGCDALVVLIDRDPVRIPLSITKERVQELSSKIVTLSVRAKLMDMTRDLCSLLREIWDEVVSLIVNFLRTVHPPGSRIWWCPTAEFTLLPFHAASPYRKGQRGLPDLYISSYASTLASLIRATRQDVSHPGTKVKRFLAICQATAIGESKLLSVDAEVANIGQRVDGVAIVTRLEGQEACIARVSEELGKNQWAHFACHGLPNRQQPFESAFALYDGRFTVQHIIHCELESPEFAYQSACHTTVGDEESPDEVIHLASAMQFVGFRSVIGTMWAIEDHSANRIASLFYDHMKDESGHLDHTRAAYALNKTVKSASDIPLDQRILYIHLGA